MREAYLVVAERIRQELSDLATAVERALQAVDGARRMPDYQDHFIASAALSLHDFYSGVERALQMIASVIDRSEPTGRHWHRELLRQMTVALPKIRPAVLSLKTESLLQEYLSFRHVVRNIYAFRLDPDRIEKLAGDVGAVLKGIDEELERFASVLETLSEGD